VAENGEDIHELGNTAQKYGGKYGKLYGRITICTANPRRQVGGSSVWTNSKPAEFCHELKNIL
jgi:hypothetical protein